MQTRPAETDLRAVERPTPRSGPQVDPFNGVDRWRTPVAPKPHFDGCSQNLRRWQSRESILQRRWLDRWQWDESTPDTEKPSMASVSGHFLSPMEYSRTVYNRPLFYRDWGWELAPDDVRNEIRPILYGIRGAQQHNAQSWCWDLGLSYDATDEDAGTYRTWYTYASSEDCRRLIEFRKT